MVELYNRSMMIVVGTVGLCIESDQCGDGPFNIEKWLLIFLTLQTAKFQIFQIFLFVCNSYQEHFKNCTTLVYTFDQMI